MGKQRKLKGYTSMVAIIGITILDALAISKGIDGVLFMTSIALIAGIAGNKILIKN